MSERELDIVIDHVNELNTDTPKVKCDKTNGVSPDLVFGLDTELFKVAYNKSGNMEEMVFDPKHQENEVDLIQVIQLSSSSQQHQRHTRDELEQWLKTLPKDDIYRVKGFVRLDTEGTLYILNHAFGRFTLTPVEHAETLDQSKDIEIKFTVMGQDLRMYKDRIEQGLLRGAQGTVDLIEAHRHDHHS